MITKKSKYTYKVHRYDPLVQDIQEEHVWRLFGMRIFTHTETVIVSDFPRETINKVSGFQINSTKPVAPEKITQQ